jgi:hypothetical protein
MRVPEDHRPEAISQRHMHRGVELVLVQVEVDDGDPKFGLVGPVGVLGHM